MLIWRVNGQVPARLWTRHWWWWPQQPQPTRRNHTKPHKLSQIQVRFIRFHKYFIYKVSSAPWNPKRPPSYSWSTEITQNEWAQVEVGRSRSRTASASSWPAAIDFLQHHWTMSRQDGPGWHKVGTTSAIDMDPLDPPLMAACRNFFNSACTRSLALSRVSCKNEIQNGTDAKRHMNARVNTAPCPTACSPCPTACSCNSQPWACLCHELFLVLWRQNAALLILIVSLALGSLLLFFIILIFVLIFIVWLFLLMRMYVTDVTNVAKHSSDPHSAMLWMAMNGYGWLWPFPFRRLHHLRVCLHHPGLNASWSRNAECPEQVWAGPPHLAPAPTAHHPNKITARDFAL